MVRARCVFVAGIHPSRTWTSGFFGSMWWNACVHRLDLGLYSHPKEFLGEWSLNPCQLQGKNPLYRKISPEEDRIRDAVNSEPRHYQRAIPAPLHALNLHAHWHRHILTHVHTHANTHSDRHMHTDTCMHARLCTRTHTHIFKLTLTQMFGHDDFYCENILGLCNINT